MLLLLHLSGVTAAGQTSNGAAAKPDPDERPSFGALDATGSGVVIHRSDVAEVVLGAYALVRYINQLPAEQQFTDHLGNVHDIDTRNDIQFHRAMIHFRGWLLSTKARYQITVWTVMSTDQTTLYGFLGYQFHKRFNVYAGINSLGGTSIGDGFASVLAGERSRHGRRVLPAQLHRRRLGQRRGAARTLVPRRGREQPESARHHRQPARSWTWERARPLWWMPTTHEFGPNGSYGDWEYHEKLATRFGVSTARSRENRQLQANTSPENTQIKLADSLNLFDAGSLAPGVTVDEADYRVLAVDAGIKYRGIFAQVEYYNRWLNELRGGWPAAGRAHPRPRVLRAGRVLSDQKEARSCTASRHESSATRTPASAAAASSSSAATTTGSTAATCARTCS